MLLVWSVHFTSQVLKHTFLKTASIAKKVLIALYIQFSFEIVSRHGEIRCCLSSEQGITYVAFSSKPTPNTSPFLLTRHIGPEVTLPPVLIFAMSTSAFHSADSFPLKSDNVFTCVHLFADIRTLGTEFDPEDSDYRVMKCLTSTLPDIEIVYSVFA